MRERLKRKQGAALIESCLVIIMLCLILFGMLQLSYLIAARDVVSYAAVGASRTAAVGSDNFMLYKSTRMLTIPTAGPMLAPASVTQGADVYGNTEGERWDYAVEHSPRNQQYWTERFLIPFFLGAENDAEARAVLNYANWEQSTTRVRTPSLAASERLDAASFVDQPVEVRQYVPLAMPFARAFYTRNMYPLWREEGGNPVVPHADMRASAAMENHAAYYMTQE